MSTHELDQSIEDLHLQLGLLQTLDVGLIILDKAYRITLWNTFMENHSGFLHTQLYNKVLFDAFPELSSPWLKQKIDSVFLLSNRSFITWEQRPYLLKFKSYRPLTSSAPYMYQNLTLIPLSSPSGKIEHIGILVYDVTDAAMGRQALEIANAKLEQLSQIDLLTGLYNRGFWESCLQEEFQRFTRVDSPSSLLMIDIDHFKKVNDTYGHPAGDEVIRQLATTLKDVTRLTDKIGRYGGEEFAVLLVGTSADKAVHVIERLQERINNLTVTHYEHKINFTLSIGLTEISSTFMNHEQWIHLADQALYKSKQNGRNQTTTLNA
jgi:diguanylate cyclase (GGDEF)-like protein